MPTTVFGLPMHPLVVHATVVLVPLAAAVLAASVVSARFRRWAGVLPLLLTALTVVLAPLSTSTGETLEGTVGESSLVERHAQLGEMLVWWCVGMLVVAAAMFLLRRSGRAVTGGTAAALAVAGLVASVGTLVQVALVGHSGAKAVWNDKVAAVSGATASGQDHARPASLS